MNSSLNRHYMNNLTVLVRVSDVTCPEGLVYDECRIKLDDFCNGGFVKFTNNMLTLIIKPKMFSSFLFLFWLYRVRYPGASLENSSPGCFCPRGQLRAGNHSHICVSDCPCE